MAKEPINEIERGCDKFLMNESRIFNFLVSKDNRKMHIKKLLILVEKNTESFHSRKMQGACYLLGRPQNTKFGHLSDISVPCVLKFFRRETYV